MGLQVDVVEASERRHRGGLKLLFATASDALVVGSSTFFRQPAPPPCDPGDAPWNSHDLQRS